MERRRTRTAILISGRGSNMAVLIRAARRPRYPAGIDLVIANRAEAAGVSLAARADIDTKIIDHRLFENKRAFEEALDRALGAAGIELICLAGFMRILSPWFVQRWRDRVVNIHPSLLPAFKGLDTHARALAAGVKIHGCTVHLVRPDVDSGPIVMQGAVPVRPDDTAATLAARVLRMEHYVYPRALAHLARGSLQTDEQDNDALAGLFAGPLTSRVVRLDDHGDYDEPL